MHDPQIAPAWTEITKVHSVFSNQTISQGFSLSVNGVSLESYDYRSNTECGINGEGRARHRADEFFFHFPLFSPFWIPISLPPFHLPVTKTKAEAEKG